MDKLEIIAGLAEKINNNKIEEAFNLILSNENKLKDSSEFWNLKSIIYIKTKKYEIALDCLKMALEIDKDNIDYLFNLAYLYELKKEWYSAYKIYGELLQIVNDDGSKEEIYKYMNNINPDDQQIIVKKARNSFKPSFGNDILSARHEVAKSIIDSNRPLVSIFVLALNNLEKYTRPCVECILKYTKEIDYELILVDNGSSDDTFEYFKTIEYSRKKIIHITKNVGSGFGMYQGFANCEGKYLVLLQYDLFVTKNWLSNLLKCAMSDENIGMVNPGLDYVSNFQAIDLKYKDFDDMQEKAAAYNISDAKKWEERLRLITLGTLFKKECLDVAGFMDYGYFHDFVDDDITFRVRRAGYKAIFCRDTFICHAGKVTDKGTEMAVKSLREGRELFKDRYYGVDAWDDVQYEVMMMEHIEAKPEYNNVIPQILGIDVKCGGAILEVKNKLRNKGIMNSELSAFSTEAKYFTDLSTICDQKVEVDRIEYFKEYFKLKKFDYIVIGKPINEYKDPYSIISSTLDLLNDDGQLLLKIKNVYDISMLVKIIGINMEIKHKEVFCLSLEGFNEYLNDKGYLIKNISAEFHNVDERFKDQINNIVSFATESDYSNAIVDNYVLNIVKA